MGVPCVELLAGGTITISEPFSAEVGAALLVDIVAAAAGSPPATCYDPPAPLLPGPVVEDGVLAQTESNIPARPSFEGGFPNPFARETRFRLSLPTTERVTITILDILGREVATIMDEDLPAGIANIIWYGHDISGNQVASGVYFYRIKAGDFVETGSVTAVR